ncbi:transcriptional regulator [Streptomyces sp. NPDC052682]|uniref:Transcriptional regulator n=1 Tax=Streptomyces swartbergensis TaxID=487165 RepID=A0A243S7V7_9ACTN|nr:transcriptional regulator [Streptomyces swartbergensis]OUD03001.1 transcriptional regulator [Streptomyces swartbergensis]
MTAAAVFAAVFVALYIAHSVGDHWVQTSHQAAHKGENDKTPGQSSRAGRIACTLHVIGLTITKGIALAAVVLVLDLPVTVTGVVAGLGIDAATHWWADRRSTLAWLAKVTGKTEFLVLGTPAHPAHPVTGEGKYAPTLGTGAYALDQSFHHLFLGVAALLIAAL